jgi:circadian clock protein KaiC
LYHCSSAGKSLKVIKIFTTGVKELDEFLKGSLEPSSMIVIAGHPGAGKTTLASKICYENALRGHKCLYASFQEDKEKLFRHMKSFGIDFELLETRGLIKHIHLPITTNIDDAVEAVNSAITSGNFQVIVVDSINALLQAASDDAARRAWLQNYFYQLSRLINGLVVLVAEIALGEEQVGPRSIEFIADAVLILRHEIENNLLVRKLEIRKARGTALNIARIPFSITERRGIELYPPPIIEKIPGLGAKVDIVCKALKNIIGDVFKGEIIYIAYPPDIRPVLHLPLLIGIAVANNLKIQLISYLYPPDSIKFIISDALETAGLDELTAKKAVKKYVTVSSLNPFAYGIEELAIREISLIRRDAGIVAFHGTELFAGIMEKDLDKYIRALYNELNYLRKTGKVIVRYGRVLYEKLYSINANLADIIVRFYAEKNESQYEVKMMVSGKGRKPVELAENDTQECLEEIAALVRERLKNT